jgi:hypothetical protein
MAYQLTGLLVSDVELFVFRFAETQHRTTARMQPRRSQCQWRHQTAVQIIVRQFRHELYVKEKIQLMRGSSAFHIIIVENDSFEIKWAKKLTNCIFVYISTKLPINWILKPSNFL